MIDVICILLEAQPHPHLALIFPPVKWVAYHGFPPGLLPAEWVLNHENHMDTHKQIHFKWILFCTLQINTLIVYMLSFIECLKKRCRKGIDWTITQICLFRTWIRDIFLFSSSHKWWLWESCLFPTSGHNLCTSKTLVAGNLWLWNCYFFRKVGFPFHFLLISFLYKLV